ncbi:reprolysin-like metallopeptidase [Oryzibacter oryziterrae]|uniref:reprolysin-like metallopeptidase n=1 Tax=Oryzibacter oryziterrae TaxID=2766474 RepID=UPI001F22A433|nr:M12 family metallo-peptidase [Oryzibacter oryziterrae]
MFALKPLLRSVAALLWLSSGLWTASAFAGDLFTDAGSKASSAASVASAKVDHAVAERVVAIDPDYLAATLVPAGMDDKSGRAAAAKALTSGYASLTLFPGTTVKLKRRDVAEAYGGGYAWSGTPTDDGFGAADLVVVGGKVSGLVNYKGMTYSIDPVDGSARLHRIARLDLEGMKEDKILNAPMTPFVPNKTSTGGTVQGITTVTVLIGYTPEVLAAYKTASRINAQANLAVSMANTAFANSKMNVRFSLVGVRAVSGYSDRAAASYNQVLEDLTNVTAPFASLGAARKSLKADLVSLFVSRQEYCGLGWVGPSVATYGTSVVTASCVSYNTLAHEAGHNLGALHDRYVSPKAPASAYGYGYVNLQARLRTIMAYDNACQVKGFSCARVPYFSTPRIRYAGKAIGSAAGNGDAADNARYIQQNAAKIAAYY